MFSYCRTLTALQSQLNGRFARTYGRDKGVRRQEGRRRRRERLGVRRVEGKGRRRERLGVRRV